MTGEVEGSCILWDGPVNENGYGRYTKEGVRRYAHRQAYCDANGVTLEDIKGEVIRHKCDNPLCVNPEHLEIGTQADNVRDMDSRGRRVTVCKRGEDHPNCRISASTVNEIRNKYDGTHGSQKRLSVEFGVPTTTVNRIVNNKGRFKHGA